MSLIMVDNEYLDERSKLEDSDSTEKHMSKLGRTLSANKSISLKQTKKQTKVDPRFGNPKSGHFDKVSDCEANENEEYVAQSPISTTSVSPPPLSENVATSESGTTAPNQNSNKDEEKDDIINRSTSSSSSSSSSVLLSPNSKNSSLQHTPKPAGFGLGQMGVLGSNDWYKQYEDRFFNHRSAVLAAVNGLHTYLKPSGNGNAVASRVTSPTGLPQNQQQIQSSPISHSSNHSASQSADSSLLMERFYNGCVFTTLLIK